MSTDADKAFNTITEALAGLDEAAVVAIIACILAGILAYFRRCSRRRTDQL
jgi:hypothetical protein